MSRVIVQKVLTEFLTRPAPGVLALKGKWGVGKTYFWKEMILAVGQELKPASYSYVTLFGLTSITALQVAIATRQQAAATIGTQLTFEEINRNFSGLAKNALKKITGWTHRLTRGTGAEPAAVGIELLAPWMIRDSVICLDDLERLNSEHITPDALLGFIGSLKEELGCKVILIFNEEQLSEETKRTYQRYREKIIDIEVEYAVTLEEAADIGIPPSTPNASGLRQLSAVLEIKNIRVLTRIVSLAKIVNAELHDLHPNVIKQALATSVLATWALFDTGEDRPTLEFLRNWNSLAYGMREAAGVRGAEDEATKERTNQWAEKIQNYGYGNTDELDYAIFEVAERGYADGSSLRTSAEKLDGQFKAGDAEGAFSAVWDEFHNRFTGSGDELAVRFVAGFKKGAKYITPINVDGVVRLLRELGCGDKADEVIETYIVARADEPDVFDLDSYAFNRDITDKTMIRRFAEAWGMARTKPTAEEILNYLEKGKAEHANVRSAVLDLNDDQIYGMLISYKGRHLHRVVSALLTHSSESKPSLAERTKRTLRKLAAESRLNEIRIRRHEVGEP